MKKVLSGVVWMGVWGIMVMEQVTGGIVAVGERGQNQAEPRAEQKANREIPKSQTKSEGEGGSYQDREIAGWGAMGGKWLVAVGGKEDESENQEMMESLQQGREGILGYLENHRGTRWEAALRYQLGKIERESGRLTRALENWEQAWELLKAEKAGEPSYELGNRVWGELSELNARIGRIGVLEKLIAEGGSREMRGNESEKIGIAKRSLWEMKNQPGESFKCGPYALGRVWSTLGGKRERHPLVEAEQSPQGGLSLQRVEELARQMGLSYRAGRREAGAEIPVPSVVHWKVNHYAAVIAKQERQGVKYYQIEDPTFGGAWWVSQEVLDEESSGYWLIAANAWPAKGWEAASKAEKAKVHGKGNWKKPMALAPSSAKSCPAMPESSLFLQNPAVKIEDTPEWYAVGQGPSADFSLTYSQREENQATWNVGPKWQMNWGECVSVELSKAPGAVCTDYQIAGSLIYHDGHGGMSRIGVASAGGSALVGALGDRRALGRWEVEVVPRDFVGMTSTGLGQPYIQPFLMTDTYSLNVLKFTRYLPNGGKKVYAMLEGGVDAYNFPATPVIPGGGWAGGSVVYRLTEEWDAAGHHVSYLYEKTDLLGYWDYPFCIYPANQTIFHKNVRLIAVVDANELVTTVGYGSNDPADPQYTLITKVTNPYGGTATLGYDAAGRLQTITDKGGLTSSFTYKGATDVITSMTTPYGVTHFKQGEGDGKMGNERWVISEHPNGKKERAALLDQAPGVAGSEPAGSVPWNVSGLQIDNNLLAIRNSYYWADWDAAVSQGDVYNHAEIYHWLKLDLNGAEYLTDVLASRKSPGEARVYYGYLGQTSPLFITSDISWNPSVIARVIDGQTQVLRKEYNPLGQVTKVTDPMGRETRYQYAANQIDLLQVQIKNSNSGWDTIQSYGGYNGAHQPATVTGADGQTTSFSYTNGALASITPPDQLSTTFAYDNEGNLTEINPPGDEKLTIIPDQGLAKTVTNQDGYAVTTDYDALDRVTKVSYPDGTYVQNLYDRLDLSWSRDRAGNWSHAYYAERGKPAMIQDPNGNVTQYEWCKCGGLAKLVDPQGHATTWVRNLQGQVTGKIYANGKAESIEYDQAGRVKKAKDPQGAESVISYHLDGAIKSITLQNAAADVTQVNLAYDPCYPRLTSRTEIGAGGNQLTTYGYQPIGQLGAGNLSLVDGPGAADTVTYGYDTMGRVVSYSLEGQASSVAYGNYGRIDSRSNALGTFINHYDAGSSRLTAVEYPNGIEKQIGRDSLAAGRRLKTLTWQGAGGSVLSKHEFERDPQGQITRWDQTSDNLTKSLYLDYDPTGQLLGLEKKDAVTGTLEKEYQYGYDGIGNRLWEKVDNQVQSLSYNLVNELQQIAGGSGHVRLEGETDQPAQIEVGGQTLTTDPSHLFRAEVPVVSGINTIPIKMTTGAGVHTRQVQLSVSGSGSENLTYDNNGNLLGDGSKTYTWDGAHHLKTVTQGTAVSTFTYDGQGRLATLTETDNGGPVTAAKEYLWIGNRLAREIDSITGIEKRFYPQGFEIEHNGAVAKYYYAKDHLGSIREVLDDQGQVLTRYDYTPYGERTKVSGAPGSPEAPFGFTGHYYHAQTGLHLTRTRAYHAKTGRWLSRDPIAEAGGLNLYAYVANNPINGTDPLGLFDPASAGAAVETVSTLDLSLFLGFGPAMFTLATASLAMGPAAAFQDPAQNMANWPQAEQIARDEVTNGPKFDWRPNERTPEDWAIYPNDDITQWELNCTELDAAIEYLLDIYYGKIRFNNKKDSDEYDKFLRFLKEKYGIETFRISNYLLVREFSRLSKELGCDQ